MLMYAYVLSLSIVVVGNLSLCSRNSHFKVSSESTGVNETQLFDIYNEHVFRKAEAVLAQPNHLLCFLNCTLDMSQSLGAVESG